MFDGFFGRVAIPFRPESNQEVERVDPKVFPCPGGMRQNAPPVIQVVGREEGVDRAPDSLSARNAVPRRVLTQPCYLVGSEVDRASHR